MSQEQTSRIPEVLQNDEAQLLTDWLQELSAGVQRPELMSGAELRTQCAEFIQALRAAVRQGQLRNLQGPEWTGLREMLASASRTRAMQGFSSRETALFILSFKRPLFTHLRRELGDDTAALARETWVATELIDELALLTVDNYQRAREEVIRRQQEELLELSTPVVKLWDGILALPLIGTLDSARTQTVMEILLQTIVDTGAEIAIIDITGVPTVDTLTAQHLIKTVTAARLMGADCIISGIRPQIAQTIVHLGVELGEIVTKASLATAFSLALQRVGATVGRPAPRA